MKKLQEIEPRTVALLIALTLGLGLALHEVFFVVALALAFVAGVQMICEHRKLTHRDP